MEAAAVCTADRCSGAAADVPVQPKEQERSLWHRNSIMQVAAIIPQTSSNSC